MIDVSHYHLQTLSGTQWHSSFPGYSACSIQCNGVDCLCAIPLRACKFYRIFNIQSRRRFTKFSSAVLDTNHGARCTCAIIQRKITGPFVFNTILDNKFENFEFTLISEQLQAVEIGRISRSKIPAHSLFRANSSFLWPAHPSSKRKAPFPHTPMYALVSVIWLE